MLSLNYTIFMLVFLMLINVNLALSAVNVSSKAPVVCIADGCLRGINNGKYDAFLSIPFAKPPLGDLRFKNPEPVDPWKGILDVTLEKQICLQKNVLFPNPLIQGSEDCLYLHVYSPKTDKEQCKRKLPVLIYIYGGGFFSGAATQNISGPDYFMETKDVVMVFLSYRVHVFGFLSTGDDDMPGNFGLKDQALGIKWTVRNIAAFGGNPNRITLIAQSAGAVSANFHMMSPQTKNLFHRVILMSGTVLTPYAYINRDPLGQFILLAEKAGILNARLLTAKQIIEKLKKMKAEDIMAATDLMKIWGAIPAVLFTPVIENCEFNEAGETTSFLCGDPLKLWAKGLYSKKPILAGNTDIEGGIIALAIITNNLAVQSFNSYFGYLLGVILEMWGSSVAQNQKIIDKVVQVYMNGTSAINANNQMGYVKIFTDRYFLEPNLRMTEQYLTNWKLLDPPIYLYKFNFTGPYSYSTLFTGLPQYFGVIHCDELIYTLRAPVLFRDFPENSAERSFIKKWIKFLINFAKTGVVEDSKPCTQYDVNAPKKCPYIYFGRSSKTSKSLVMEQRADLPLKLTSFWGQIDEYRSPSPWCDVFNKSLTSCADNQYCC